MYALLMLKVKTVAMICCFSTAAMSTDPSLLSPFFGE